MLSYLLYDKNHFIIIMLTLSAKKVQNLKYKTGDIIRHLKGFPQNRLTQDRTNMSDWKQ